MKQARVLLRIFFCIIIYFGSFLHVAKANFGRTCITVQNQYMSNDILNDISTTTMYKFVLSLIDIENCGTNFSGGCVDTSPDTLNLCFKNLNDSSSVANASNSTANKLQVGQNYNLGNLTNHPIIANDINLQSIQLVPGLIGSNLCLTMQTQFGYAPLVCRASSVIDLSEALPDASGCNISKSCNLKNSNDSMIKNSVLGATFECFQHSLSMIFFNPSTCYYTNSNIDQQIEAYTSVSTTSFSTFFGLMKNVVLTTVTLYVVKIGIEMALSPESFKNVGSIFMPIIKIIVVIYFSIGMDYNNWFTGRNNNSNGITALVLPLATQFSDDMALYFMNRASTTRLCYLTKDDYPANSGYYAIWDSLDCRFYIYSGLMPVLFNDEARSGMTRINIAGEEASSPPKLKYDTSGIPPGLLSSDRIVEGAGAGGNSYPEGMPILIVMASLIFGGKGILSWVVPLFIIMFIAVLSVTVFTRYVASLMFVYVLAYVAPIFVPMMLFERTKGYYDKWIALIFSCSLQPVVFVSMASFCLAMIDNIIFHGCVFAKYEHNNNYLFGLMMPEDTAGASDCKNSMGYSLMRYYQTDFGWQHFGLRFFYAYINTDPGSLLTKSWMGFIICFFMVYFVSKIEEVSTALSQALDTGSISPVAAVQNIGKAIQDAREKAESAYTQVGAGYNSMRR